MQSMDESIGQILNAYYSVSLSTEISGIFCIYYLILNQFQQILLLFNHFEELPEEEDNSEDEEEDSDEDFIFDLDHFNL